MLMWLYIGAGALLILISIPLYLGKIGPNGFYGFRVRKTLENPALWFPVNRCSAGWLMVTGVLTMFTAAALSLVPGLSVDLYALVCLGVFVAIFAVGLVKTVRYMNSL